MNQNYSKSSPKICVEDAFDQALEQVRHGVPLATILAHSPASYRAELAGLLEVAASGLLIAKNEPPRALRRYRFAETSRPQRVLASIFPWLKIGAVPAGVLAALVISVSAVNAKPGMVLFPVKQQFEQIPARLTQNQDKKASIQLKIAQKRLNDAVAVINSPSSNSAEQTAALSELNEQTQTALVAVKEVATAMAISKGDNSSLLNSMTQIADAQAELATKVKEQPSPSPEADSVLATSKESKNAVAEIKRLTSAVNDQELANLDHNAVFVIGLINLKNTGGITVENNSFVIDQNTVIKNEDDKPIGIAELNLNTKVSIIGNKNSRDQLVASKITVLAEPETAADPEVKGDTDAEPDAAANQTVAPTAPSAQPTPDESPDKSISSEPDPNTAVGGVIFEAPANLFQ